MSVPIRKKAEYIFRFAIQDHIDEFKDRILNGDYNDDYYDEFVDNVIDDLELALKNKLGVTY